ncbi:type II secretion system protein [Rhodopirellula europaea]|uniref:Protein containing Prepilin-type cleavage/methylation n=1 Tax=Rhodopirellula europaea 6C TaxID=1263867 RepID=M2B3U7_9BACT|nr:prepilin-type N-terminal cleavage/methylation domain-containing protein [Rhodopirellula europaea]EMB16889.1 protein containing Prepilin-type cleavage/methylation [Rhodopirellula europaea 6C]
MNARTNLHQPARVAPTTRSAFTLVEMLVVIGIIGILSAILIPAVTNAVRRARVTNLRLEVTSLEQAVEQYQQKYGDYPPDFSSWAIVERHYRKVFPRMSTNDQTLLYNMLHVSGVFQAANLDRGEVLAWTLGGYSDDTQRPFTGAGGPLVWTGDGSNTYEAATALERQDPRNFQVNIDRPNSLVDFDVSQLDYNEVDPGTAMTYAAGNRRESSDGDLFLSYRSDSEGAPFVYFDSRTYALYDPNVSGGAGDFNGYGSTTYGYVRPFLSTNANANRSGGNYTDQAAALGAWQFMNPNTFQIISAGLDNNFGATASYDVNGDSNVEPIYFQYDTGAAIALLTGAGFATPGDLVVTSVSKYQESAFGDNEQYPADNITNFSNGTVVDDVP